MRRNRSVGRASRDLPQCRRPQARAPNRSNKGSVRRPCGRQPGCRGLLDDLPGLARSSIPGVARLICRAASRSGSSLDPIAVRARPAAKRRKRKFILSKATPREPITGNTERRRARRIGRGRSRSKTAVGGRPRRSGGFWSETGAENRPALRGLIPGVHFDEARKQPRNPVSRQKGPERADG